MALVKGTYGLILELRPGVRLGVGRLGTFSFPTGYYLYTGSARGGLEARLRRHLRREKPLKWHIDYLRREAKILEIWWSTSDSAGECAWHQAASQLPGARIPVRGFGSSDCRCLSHLVYLPQRPSVEGFRRRLPGVPVNRHTPIGCKVTGLVTPDIG